jgi:transposase
MRQLHVAGERMFVDYAGTTLDVVDETIGEIHVCQLFVAVLGASKFGNQREQRNPNLLAARLERSEKLLRDVI